MKKGSIPAFAAALAGPLSLTPLWGQETPPLEEPAVQESAPELLDYGLDGTRRMTVPVSVAGRGPFPFIVDTGAERTVISRELARNLDLEVGDTARMHSMSEVSDIATVVIPHLEVGKKRVKDIHAPALYRHDLGAEGMLGVDSLQTQRVIFDFVAQQMSITPSRKTETRWPKGEIVVTARNRFGHLVLIDASIEGQKVYAVIDTGSQATIGNNALRRKLERKKKLGATVPVAITSVTGGKTPADQGVAKSMTLGGVEIFDMPVAFADVHPFRKLDLMDKPAILLGMDALKLFDRVSVDFANRRVRLLRPGSSSLREPTQLASRGPLRPRF